MGHVTPAKAAPATPTTGDEKTESLDPGILARAHRERVTARVAGVVKKCRDCGIDVTEDMFRLKLDRGGYVCAECQDKELERNLAARERRLKILWVALVILFVGVSTMGVMAITSLIPTTKSSTKK